MRDVIVRAATVADAQMLADVHVEGRTWAYRGLVPDELLDSAAERRTRERMWARFVTEPAESTFALLAERGGRGVGLVSAGPSRDDDEGASVAEVYSIYLRSEDLLGTGVGRALMVAALERLRRGFREATLWALGTNERARRFYEAGGWRSDGARRVATLADTPLETVRFRIVLPRAP